MCASKRAEAKRARTRKKRVSSDVALPYSSLLAAVKDTRCSPFISAIESLLLLTTARAITSSDFARANAASSSHQARGGASEQPPTTARTMRRRISIQSMATVLVACGLLLGAAVAAARPIAVSGDTVVDMLATNSRALKQQAISLTPVLTGSAPTWLRVRKAGGISGKGSAVESRRSAARHRTQRSAHTPRTQLRAAPPLAVLLLRHIQPQLWHAALTTATTTTIVSTTLGCWCNKNSSTAARHLTISSCG